MTASAYDCLHAGASSDLHRGSNILDPSAPDPGIDRDQVSIASELDDRETCVAKRLKDPNRRRKIEGFVDVEADTRDTEVSASFDVVRGWSARQLRGQSHLRAAALFRTRAVTCRRSTRPGSSIQGPARPG